MSNAATAYRLYFVALRAVVLVKYIKHVLLGQSYLDAAPFTRVTPCSDFFMRYFLECHFRCSQKQCTRCHLRPKDGVEGEYSCARSEKHQDQICMERTNGKRGTESEERRARNENQ